jgi:hypothetical protein
MPHEEDLVHPAILLTACFSAPPPPPHDVTQDEWLWKERRGNGVHGPRSGCRFRGWKPDDAAAVIEKGETISGKLPEASRPTLEAMQAASNLDYLYARVLFSGKNYGWARLMFQKNLARWKHWAPQTPETERRIKQAQDRIDPASKTSNSMKTVQIPSPGGQFELVDREIPVPG